MEKSQNEKCYQFLGGCHCKNIRFRVSLDSEQIKVWRCNCSLCTMKQNHHFIIPLSSFHLFPSSSSSSPSVTPFKAHPFLSLYQYGTKTARHLFCRECGVQCFYVPRSNPDGVGVTIYCLDDYHSAIPLSSSSPHSSSNISIVSSCDGSKCEFLYHDFDGFGGWEASYSATGIASQSK